MNDRQFDELLQEIDRRYDEFREMIDNSDFFSDAYQNFYQRPCPWKTLPPDEVGKKYYIVIAKCGHVGRAFFVPVPFGVCASSGKEAAELARELPRVKHDYKDAIIGVKEVDEKTYLQRRTKNYYDLYLNIDNSSEAKIIRAYMQPRIFKTQKRLEMENEPYELRQVRKVGKTYKLHQKHVKHKKKNFDEEYDDTSF